MTVAERQDALRLPRDRWPDHPHYPSQALLLGSHDHFRQTSRTLVERASRGGNIASIGLVFSMWKSAMSNHERYEEGKLYPYLEARWGLSCDALRDGHDTLAQLEQAVRSAVDREDQEALHAALSAHDETLLAHLDEEEALVIPALLALRPEEFDRYAHSSIRTLLAELDTEA